MKKSRVLKPALQALEDRTVMSFSLSNFFHSVLPFIPSDSSKNTPHLTASQRSALIQKRWDAKEAAATKATALPTTHLATAQAHPTALQLYLEKHAVSPASKTTTTVK